MYAEKEMNGKIGKNRGDGRRNGNYKQMDYKYTEDGDGDGDGDE